MVYAVSTQRPIINSTAILLGHTLAYFSAGIIIALGLERIINRLENPHHIDFIISLLIGILLLWVTFRSLFQSWGERILLLTFSSPLPEEHQLVLLLL